MLVSVVTTMYQSAEYLPECYARTISSLAPFGHDLEFVFVDDGSGDRSVQVAKSFMDETCRIRIVELSRNFGHHPAILAGLRYAEGDLVFLIDCDLEEPPEIFGNFYRIMMAAPEDDPIDVVYGVMEKRQGAFLKNTAARFFYSILTPLLSVRLPTDVMTARLMRRRYVQGLLEYAETQIYLMGLMTIVGFNQVAVSVEKPYKGSTTYTVRKRVSMTLEALTSFSDAPLYVIFWIGFLTSIVAFTGGLFLLAARIIAGVKFLNGWASLMVTIAFFSGLIASSIGVIGIYVGKVFRESKRRPRYIVKDIRTNF
jgi:putative glycosyltransferase